ncbi:MAG: cobalamin-independent methionine synthase II family protein [Erythrobacter sp.]|uniref:cobalamin-independent methionine synthase II family protein n=1 Tax=Erythrobacter sp. TaxID=1042 RepID=UPI003A869880
MTERILTTHVGSLPRSKAVSDMIFAKERDEDVDEGQFREILAEAVAEIVRRQVEAGIDLVSDGEMSKISYATYIKDRVTGFDGDSPRDPPADLEQFPSFLERQAKGGGTPTYRRPKCVGDIRPKDSAPLELDLANFRAALNKHQSASGFMNAASPGVIALFQPNEHYVSQDEYLEAIAEAMRVEYEAIVDAGLLLQLDSPDLGLGRHMMFKDRTDQEYTRLAERHVEVLNHATRNIAPEMMRMHICWGNYEGPHTCDAPLEQVLPIALKARPQALLFESANPRHAHEWQAVRDADIPEDKVLVPGVIDSTTNYVEHPKLVAERLLRFADIVGRDRVIAGTDCGFSTFAGFGAVDPAIVFAKFGALSEGARIASDCLWGRAAA